MERTFANAAESYIRQGGESKYTIKLSDYFKDRDVSSITPAEFRQMAIETYKTQKNSTLNRYVITPARAVMYHAHDLGWCGPLRIKKFKVEKSKKHSPVNGDWLSSFINQSDRDGLFHLSALCLFMNHTAARVSEAVNLKGRDIDMRHRKATLVKTKTDVMATAYLTDELVFRLYNLEFELEENVFKYTSRFSVNERIRSVCKRAGIPYKSTHCIGRYSFATNAISLGVGVKAAMDAGRWKSSTIFLETYVHAEDAGRLVADKFNSQRYKNL